MQVHKKTNNGGDNDGGDQQNHCDIFKDQNKSNTCHIKDCQKQSQQVGECGKVGGGLCMLVVLYYIVDSNHYHQEQLQL